MAWPASTQSLSENFILANKSMLRSAEIVGRLSVLSETSEIKVQQILNILVALDEMEAQLANMAAYGQSMIDYAQAEFRDPLLDVVAEYTSVRAAGSNLAAWIRAAIADDTVVTKTLNDVAIDNTYTSAQLAEFRTRSSVFTVTID